MLVVSPPPPYLLTRRISLSLSKNSLEAVESQVVPPNSSLNKVRIIVQLWLTPVQCICTTLNKKCPGKPSHSCFREHLHLDSTYLIFGSSVDILVKNTILGNSVIDLLAFLVSPCEWRQSISKQSCDVSSLSPYHSPLPVPPIFPS